MLVHRREYHSKLSTSSEFQRVQEYDVEPFALSNILCSRHVSLGIIRPYPRFHDTNEIKETLWRD